MQALTPTSSYQSLGWKYQLTAYKSHVIYAHGRCGRWLIVCFVSFFFVGRTNEYKVFFRGLGPFGRVLHIWSVWYYRVLNILIWYYFCPLYGIHIREYLVHVGAQHCWALEQRGDALVTCWKRLAALDIIRTSLSQNRLFSKNRLILLTRHVSELQKVI